MWGLGQKGGAEQICKPWRITTDAMTGAGGGENGWLVEGNAGEAWAQVGGQTLVQVRGLTGAGAGAGKMRRWAERRWVGVG